MEDGGWRMWRETAGQHERMNPVKETKRSEITRESNKPFWCFEDFDDWRFMIQISTTGGSWFWFSLVHGGVKLPLISWDCHTLPSSCTKEDDACLNCSWLCWNFIFHLQKQQKNRVLLWMFFVTSRLVLNTMSEFCGQRQTFNVKHF